MFVSGSLELRWYRLPAWILLAPSHELRDLEELSLVFGKGTRRKFESRMRRLRQPRPSGRRQSQRKMLTKRTLRGMQPRNRPRLPMSSVSGQNNRRVWPKSRRGLPINAQLLAAEFSSALTRYPQHSFLLAVEAVKAGGVRVAAAEQLLREALGS